MSTHPSYRHAETYIAERHNRGEWVEVMRFPSSANAREYVRNNTPEFSPWRIVRLRMTTISEVLESQPTTPTAWCLCGVVDDRGDGTCGKCDLPIMPDDADAEPADPGATR